MVEPAVPAGWRLLGAVGPRMSRLAAERTAGLHPFLVTPEYATRTRRSLGPAPLIAPHLAVVLGDGASRARAIARDKVGFFFDLPAYGTNLRRLGFTDADLAGGGSDRLVDTVVAHGSVDRIATRSASTWPPAPTTSPCTSCPTPAPCPAPLTTKPLVRTRAEVCSSTLRAHGP